MGPGFAAAALAPRLSVIAIAGVLFLGGLGYVAHRIYKAGYGAAVLHEQRTREAIAEAAHAFDLKTAERIGAMEVKNVTIRQTIQKELTRDVVYRECIASERVLQLTNEAITGRAVPPGGIELPTSGPVK